MRSNNVEDLFNLHICEVVARSVHRNLPLPIVECPRNIYMASSMFLTGRRKKVRKSQTHITHCVRTHLNTVGMVFSAPLPSAEEDIRLDVSTMLRTAGDSIFLIGIFSS